jgi:hypothetical protein
MSQILSHFYKIWTNLMDTEEIQCTVAQILQQKKAFGALTKKFAKLIKCLYTVAFGA